MHPKPAEKVDGRIDMTDLWGKSVVTGVLRSALLMSALGFAVVASGQAPPPTAKAVGSTASVPASVADKTDLPIQPAADAENTPEITLDPASLVPDLPPLPSANVTLIGGTIERIDPVQDEITIHIFGGGKMKVLFDPRTNISNDGEPGSLEELKAGKRIYADTILLNGRVFARNIRFSGSSSLGECQGVVESYRANNDALVLRDLLSPAPMNLRLNADTRITRGNQAGSAGDLVPGTLVSVKFSPEPGGRPLARQVTILITPGTEFRFNGRITTLDLHLGLLVVTSPADHRAYEIHFDPATLSITPDLREGAEVTVLTRYDGNRYVARGVTVISNPAN